MNAPRELCTTNSQSLTRIRHQLHTAPKTSHYSSRRYLDRLGIGQVVCRYAWGIQCLRCGMNAEREARALAGDLMPNADRVRELILNDECTVFLSAGSRQVEFDSGQTHCLDVALGVCTSPIVKDGFRDRVGELLKPD